VVSNGSFRLYAQLALVALAGVVHKAAENKDKQIKISTICIVNRPAVPKLRELLCAANKKTIDGALPNTEKLSSAE
jgi:hypothetical protein